MKNKFIWLSLSFLMVTAMLLVSCATSTTTLNSTTIPTSTISTTNTTSTTRTSTSTPLTTNATTTAATGNWWDSLGTPQYGGEMILSINADITNFDPYNSVGAVNVTDAWLEKLVGDDWTLNPTIFDYKIGWRPPQYCTGDLAKSWEFTDPTTFVIHLRQGIHWQNLPPASGREFTADDVVFHYDRTFGKGDGFTKPSPYFANYAQASTLISVTATDKYTVIFKWTTHNEEFTLENMLGLGEENAIECPDSVNLWGDLNDWHHAVGTGPFILTDFVSGSSATMVKNPNYWAYDERYPQNQLPYVNGLKFLIIRDNATALSAMRSGKLDVLYGQSPQNAQLMMKTNPEILQLPTPQGTACAIGPRNDKTPFNDFRVREALQMAIDLPTIANTYYAGTCSPNPSTLTSSIVAGWGFPYNQWPQDLKDQYTYNPTQAKALLTAAGYPNGFNTDIVVSSNSDLNLLEIVKSYFAAIDVNMDIRTMDQASWLSFVRVGNKNDAMAMAVGQDPLGICYQPSVQAARFTTSNSANWTKVDDQNYNSLYTQIVAAQTVDETKTLFSKMNELVARQHYAISLLQPMQYAFCQPWLKGYNGQARSITAETNAPLLCYFYASRFWIDLSLER